MRSESSGAPVKSGLSIPDPVHATTSGAFPPQSRIGLEIFRRAAVLSGCAGGAFRPSPDLARPRSVGRKKFFRPGQCALQLVPIETATRVQFPTFGDVLVARQVRHRIALCYCGAQARGGFVLAGFKAGVVHPFKLDTDRIVIAILPSPVL